jgi:hypothetical protein
MREDYGKYACHASSIKGAAEKTIEISGMPQRGFHYRWVVKSSAVDLDSMGPRYPDPDSQSGSGSRWAKMTLKHRKRLLNLI